MKRLLVLAAILVLASLPLLAGDHCAKSANCCKEGGKCCKGVEGAKWSAVNLPDGVKITATTEDKASVEKLQKSAADCCKKECPMKAEGVTRTVEKTSDGVVITATSKDADVVKKIQACAAKMNAGSAAKTTGSASCCPKGEKKGCCPGKAAAA